MTEYLVTIPIAGHAFIDVEADSAEEAQEKAFEIVRRDHIEEWEPLTQFNSGNVCYCPSPWEVKVEVV